MPQLEPISTNEPSLMTRPPVPQLLEDTRIIAIMRGTESTLAVETAEALLAGGVAAVEVTFNTPGVLDMIAAIHAAFGDRVLVGAGTVLDIDSAQAALDAGATFIVSPHTDVALIGAMAKQNVTVMPGAFTATEVHTAWQAGASLVKLFPSGPAGPGYLKDMRGPFNQVPFVPTGGITLENAVAFKAAGAWGFGLGTALVDRQLILDRAFDEITRRAKAFRDIAAA